MATTVIETVGLNVTLICYTVWFPWTLVRCPFSEPISVPVMNLAVVNLKMFVGIQKAPEEILI